MINTNLTFYSGKITQWGRRRRKNRVYSPFELFDKVFICRSASLPGGVPASFLIKIQLQDKRRFCTSKEKQFGLFVRNKSTHYLNFHLWILLIIVLFLNRRSTTEHSYKLMITHSIYVSPRIIKALAIKLKLK